MTLSTPLLTGLPLALGVAELPPLSPAEQILARDALLPDTSLVHSSRDAILRGDDPLGDSFCALRSPQERRPLGATVLLRDYRQFRLPRITEATLFNSFGT